MRFTVNNRLQRPAVAARSVDKKPAAMAKPRVQQPQNAMGSIFKNMVEGKYVTSWCSSCSGAR